jgi:hypothetical protein
LTFLDQIEAAPARRILRAERGVKGSICRAFPGQSVAEGFADQALRVVPRRVVQAKERSTARQPASPQPVHVVRTCEVGMGAQLNP